MIIASLTLSSYKIIELVCKLALPTTNMYLRLGIQHSASALQPAEEAKVKIANTNYYYHFFVYFYLDFYIILYKGILKVGVFLQNISDH